MHARTAPLQIAAALGFAALAGCNVTPVDNSALEGVWSVSRGALKMTVEYQASGGGEVQNDSQTSEVGPLDPADFPDVFAPLVQQWNDGLAEINAAIDAALPSDVLVSFPDATTMRLTDPNDAMKTADGLFLNDQFLFGSDLSGAGEGSEQGGGGVLTVATIDGTVNRAALTATGKIARTLLVALIGGDGSLVFTIQISVDITLERTGDAP